MEKETLYKICTFLGTLIFILIFANYYIEADMKERNLDGQKTVEQKHDGAKKVKQGKGSQN